MTGGAPTAHVCVSASVLRRFWVRLPSLELLHHVARLACRGVWASLGAGRAAQSENLLHLHRELLEEEKQSAEGWCKPAHRACTHLAARQLQVDGLGSLQHLLHVQLGRQLVNVLRWRRGADTGR